MLGLFYPYGIVLQALAILHFARRRPDTYWLWIILIGGGLGALVYILAEVLPDARLLHGAYQVFPRRKRIRQLEAMIIDNPSIGNYEELGDLYLDDQQYAKARDCLDRVVSRSDEIDPRYRRALAEIGLDDMAAAAAEPSERAIQERARDLDAARDRVQLRLVSRRHRPPRRGARTRRQDPPPDEGDALLHQAPGASLDPERDAPEEADVDGS
jgi:tetratricopeptide (TPR) repeat protein